MRGRLNQPPGQWWLSLARRAHNHTYRCNALARQRRRTARACWM